MKHSGNQSQETPRTGVIRRIVSRYIPSEDSNLAAFVRWALSIWRVVKVLAVAAGIIVIARAGQLIGEAYMAIPPVLVTGLAKVIQYSVPFFRDLIVASLNYIWQPILLYILISFLTKSLLWRKFWYLVCVAGFFLVFVVVVEDFSWPVVEEFSWSGIKEFSRSAVEQFKWEEYRILPLILMQGYLFALWLLPRECWNIIGLVLSSALGLIILISPFDLPTALDDFGMFGAILTFFLGYLNALASLVQRLVRRL